jgi:hypothetical protein
MLGRLPLVKYPRITYFRERGRSVKINFFGPDESVIFGSEAFPRAIVASGIPDVSQGVRP